MLAIHQPCRSGGTERSITKLIVRTKILMQRESQLKGLRVGVCLLVMLVTGNVQSDQFRTKDPLKAFVDEEYPWGDDYFIHRNRDTYLFRCNLSKKTDGTEGIAFSEISIWGNHGGPWEIFRKTEKGDSRVYPHRGRR